MEHTTINFTASGQILTPGGACYASNIVNYIQAVFALGDGWSGFDAVRAVWSTGFTTISTVLDQDGTCIVPQEVLAQIGKVYVNLVGSITENTTLTDRLTTYPVLAVNVDAYAQVEGSETAEITASQFEQYVSQVATLAGSAQTYRDTALVYAERAEQAATTAGYIDVEIVNGRLIYTKTDAVDVDFDINEAGHLVMEVI